MALALPFGERPHDGEVEAVLLQRRDQMACEAGVAGIVGLPHLLLVGQASADRLAVEDADRRHVVVMEQLFLIVADDDQRIQSRRCHVVAQPRHRCHRLAMASCQTLGSNSLQRVRRRAREQFSVAARVAIEVDELPRLVAGQETDLPVLDARGEHRAVRRTESSDQLCHATSLLAASCADPRLIHS